LQSTIAAMRAVLASSPMLKAPPATTVRRVVRPGDQPTTASRSIPEQADGKETVRARHRPMSKDSIGPNGPALLIGSSLDLPAPFSRANPREAPVEPEQLDLELQYVDTDEFLMAL